MQEAIVLSRPEPSPFRRLIPVLSLSAVLHAVLLWWIGQSPLTTEFATGPAKPKTLHLTLSSTNRMQSDTREPLKPAQSSATDLATPSAMDSAETKRQKRTEHDESPARTTHRERASSTKILAAARELAKKMARQERRETQPEQDGATSLLAERLKPRREAPGVKALADGTIRVVTEFGLVYCIRPTEDWRVLGPEDTLQVSVICK